VTISEVVDTAKGRTPSATLIMRVWRETDSPQSFRARFVTVHPDGQTTELGTAATPDDALSIVSHWIEKFLSLRPPPDHQPH